jgi:hypothetical protein
MVRQAGKKLITEGAKKVVTAVRGRGRPKGSTNKPKTVKRSEAPIQSERSKITAANATAANTRQSKSIANKAFGANAAGGVSKAKTPMFKGRNKGLEKATVVGVAATPAIVGGGIYLANRGKKPAPAKVTFADAFREARAKGEGTKFTHDGKPYVAVTKTDLKKKGYDDNELGAYNKRGGKARGALNRLGQGVKKVLLGKDKKFGGDKGAIDFIRKPVKKAGGGMMKAKGYKDDGSVQKMKRGGSAGGAGNFLKGAARKAYQAKTAPLQVASRLAQKIAPDSGVARGLGRAASPFKKGGLAIKGQGKAFLKSKR